MNVQIESSWKEKLDIEFQKPYFLDLVSFLRNEYSNHKIYPPGPLIFNAFNNCSFHDLKIVILGQDPYHGDKQAHGLSFSVPDSIRQPPSLQNIFKELEFDLGKKPPADTTVSDKLNASKNLISDKIYKIKINSVNST